jgi:hypothetical protein
VKNRADLSVAQCSIMETLARAWRDGQRHFDFPLSVKAEAEALCRDFGYVSKQQRQHGPDRIRLITTVRGREAWMLNVDQPGPDTAPDTTDHVTVGGTKGRWVCSCGEVVASGLDHQRGMAS